MLRSLRLQSPYCAPSRVELRDIAPARRGDPNNGISRYHAAASLGHRGPEGAELLRLALAWPAKASARPGTRNLGARGRVGRESS
jgi:hypothetical protein